MSPAVDAGLRLTGSSLLAWIESFAGTIATNRDHLTDLDAAIGDADHGINMDRGMRAVLQKVDSFSGDPAALLKAVGMTLMSTVGGAGGPLYGTLFIRMGAAVAGMDSISAPAWGEALRAGVEGVQARGKAEPGDKTMIDALVPGSDAFRQAMDEGASFAEALARSAAAAEAGMRATIPLIARRGRASYLGPRSAGHQDPGATSSYLLLAAASAILGRNPDPSPTS